MDNFIAKYPPPFRLLSSLQSLLAPSYNTHQVWIICANFIVVCIGRRFAVWFLFPCSISRGRDVSYVAFSLWNSTSPRNRQRQPCISIIDCHRHLVTRTIHLFLSPTGIGFEATYDCFPPLVSNNSNYPILDDFFIIGGATMATAATTASLGNIHLLAHPLHITFGITRRISSIAHGNTKRFWFNLPQNYLFGPKTSAAIVVVPLNDISHTIYASTSPVILDFWLHNYYSHTNCLEPPAPHLNNKCSKYWSALICSRSVVEDPDPPSAHLPSLLFFHQAI